jgi:hypothetical protein
MLCRRYVILNFAFNKHPKVTCDRLADLLLLEVLGSMLDGANNKLFIVIGHGSSRGNGNRIFWNRHRVICCLIFISA